MSLPEMRFGSGLKASRAYLHYKDNGYHENLFTTMGHPVDLSEDFDQSDFVLIGREFITGFPLKGL